MHSNSIIATYYNIPEEMRLIPSWVCWRLEDIGAKKPTKIPYSVTGELANVNDPNTWSTFEEVIKLRQNPPAIPYSGIGFVFSERDPYCFIDLDDPTGDAAITDRQLKIFHEFDSYAEVSPSGKGLHIIIRGHIPQGRRRSNIEIYSSQRYATMTGHSYNPKPINDYQEKLDILFEQMGSGGPTNFVYNGNEPEKDEDKVIIDIATKATNGEKFLKLLTGDWQEIYQSQSEADLSFIDMLAFYTKNRNQITRIFRQSPLGARPKAKRNDYINRMIDRSFDRMLPLIDIDGFKIAAEKYNGIIHNSHIGAHGNFVPEVNSPVAQRLEPSAHNGNVAGSNPAGTTTLTYINSDNPISASAQRSEIGFVPKPVSQVVKAPLFESGIKGSNPLPAAKHSEYIGFEPVEDVINNIPPGLLGEIAQFIYAAAPRPVPEIALGGALGLLAGICGRAYNISGTGLNQYILVITKTGRGKEAMASGIDRLMESVRMSVPTSINFIGPAEIASGQALVRYLNDHPCFVSILGEFGLRLKAISSQSANSSEVNLRRMLLDLFNKSGFGQVFRGSIYSKKEENISATNAPAFSILAESTPKRFYENMSEDMIAEGLLPRFTLIEYNGKRPASNRNHLNALPTFSLIERFASLIAQCEMIMAAKRVINIETVADANRIFEAFDKYCDNKINSNEENEISVELWNRAHMKSLKIAALIAVGVNLAEPLILPEYANWAIGMVINDIRSLSAKVEQGELGSSTHEIKQLERAKYILKEYLNLPHEKAETYKVPPALFVDKIVPKSFLSRRLASHTAFQNDRMGSTIALNRAIQALIDGDVIREMPTTQMVDKYGTRQKAYVISNVKALGVD